MQKILIIGCGLIGFSFARAIKNTLPNCTILVFDKDQDTVAKALSSGISSGYYDFSSPINDLDLIVISSPLSSYKDIFDKIDLKIPKTPIIDLGSLNNYPLSIINENLQERFISCHPIAGSEKSGIDNSDASLFDGKKFIASFSKTSNTEQNREILENIAKIIGSSLVMIEPKEHDRIFGLVSHLPQFLSFLSSDMVPELGNSQVLAKSFRLNNSNPEIWSDIFEINSTNIEKYYGEFFENLCDMIDAIDSSEYKYLYEEITENKALFANNEQNIEKITDFTAKKEDFAKILFRLIIVLSYGKIKDIDKYSNYAGTGFADFTSIINLFKDIDFDYFSKLLSSNKNKIIDYFDKIST